MHLFRGYKPFNPQPERMILGFLQYWFSNNLTPTMCRDSQLVVKHQRCGLFYRGQWTNENTL